MHPLSMLGCPLECPVNVLPIDFSPHVGCNEAFLGQILAEILTEGEVMLSNDDFPFV